ncbi:MAG: hypothetical protein M1135_02550 [Candidatus Omnitrophica bacterium]|nr:hypothetical protein [Candidatus Omnitrophota bacterium]
MKKLILLLMGIIVTTCFGGITVKNIKFMGWNGIEVNNGLIKVIVLKDIGGRIVKYIDDKTGDNYLRMVPWNLKIPPDKLIDTGNYGGISDIGTTGWPGYFWDKKYSFTINKSPDKVILTGKCKSDGIEIIRNMEIKSNSTKLKFFITQKNISPHPISMIIRLHGEFKVGKRADRNDVYEWIYKGKLNKRRYRPSDLIRFSIDKVDDGWSGVIDEKGNKVLIRTYPPYNKTHNIFWWAGFYEGDPNLPVRNNKGGFYNFERYPNPVTVQPGQSISQKDGMFILNNMDSLAFVKDNLAGGLKISKNLVGNEGLNAIFSIGSPDETENTIMKISVSVFDGNKLLLEQTKQVKNLKTGEGENIIFNIPTKDFADGKYKITASLLKGREEIYKISKEFQINKELIEKYKKMIENEEKGLQEIKGENYPFPEWRGLITYLIKKQKDYFYKGEYDKLGKNNKSVMKYIEKALEETKK